MATEENWVVRMAKALDTVVIHPDGGIDVKSYVACFRNVPEIYDALFTMAMIRNQLKSDISYSLDNIESWYTFIPDQKGHTLQGIVAFGQDMSVVLPSGKKNTHKEQVSNPKSAVRGVLWTNRACLFLTAIVRGLLEQKDKKASLVASEAYEAHLKKYHGWLVSKVVGPAMSAAPARADILSKLNIEDSPVGEAQVRAFLDKMQPVLDAILKIMQTTMDSEGNTADFPDKV